MKVPSCALPQQVQAVMPGMISRGYGRIINMASTAGEWGSLNQSAYNVSKYAVVALTRCVALELAKTGVTVNAICPGSVQTDMVDKLKNEVTKSAGISPDDLMKIALTRVPMGRILEPREISGMAVLLASPAGSDMTGQSVQVDGGVLLS